MNDNMKPIAVGVSEARAMGRWGLTRFYQKVLPELDSFLDGKSRKITVESIERYINSGRSRARAHTAAVQEGGAATHSAPRAAGRRRIVGREELRAAGFKLVGRPRLL